MNILATVCARAGSKGVANKNIRSLDGIPLIAHSIRQLKTWGKASHIVVSTDSEDIKAAAIHYGAEVPFDRPSEMAQDNSPKLPAIRHAFRKSEAIFNEKFDCVVDVDPTSPLRRTEDFEGIMNVFGSGDYDCVFTVVPAHKNPYFNMVEQNKDGEVQLCKTLAGDVVRRQDAPKVFNMNASIYVYSRDFLLDDRLTMPYSGRPGIYVMDEISAFDIDRDLDFKIVEFLYPSFNEHITA